LERTKEDLLRRNTFLQKEIEKEKTEISNLVPRKKLDEAKNKNQHLQEIHESTNHSVRKLFASQLTSNCKINYQAPDVTTETVLKILVS